MRQDGAEDGIDQRAPDQIAGDRKVLAEQVQRCGVPKGPRGSTTKDNSVTIEFSSPSADVHRPIDEQLDVVGHALVGVVGGIALQAACGSGWRSIAAIRRDSGAVIQRRQRICSH